MDSLSYSIHTSGDSGRNISGWDPASRTAEKERLCQQDHRQVVRFPAASLKRCLCQSNDMRCNRIWSSMQSATIVECIFNYTKKHLASQNNIYYYFVFLFQFCVKYQLLAIWSNNSSIEILLLLILLPVQRLHWKWKIKLSTCTILIKI